MALGEALQWEDPIRSKSIAVAAGLLTHLVLVQGEPDSHAWILPPLWTICFAGATWIEYTSKSGAQTLAGAVSVSAIFGAVYFATLLTSVALYRGFFHRLRKFPGPFLARFSKLYAASLVVRSNMQFYKEVEKLHKQYGDIVRLGPRELSIIDPDAIPLIHGPTTRCVKGPWYSATKHIEGRSIETTRDREDHKERRKVWERGFNGRSLLEYEPRLNRHAYSFIAKLKEHAAAPALRISNWVNFYSFDVMGDIGFSRSFGMLEKGKEDPLIEALHKSMSAFAVVGHMPWFATLLTRLAPMAVKDLFVFIDWTSSVLKERKRRTPDEHDIFGWLIKDDSEEIPLDLNNDTRVLIVAGSDTTAATLTWLFCELCKHPDTQLKLRKIIDDIAGDKDFLDVKDVASIPYLDGVINEAMRLHPAVPSGVMRVTPPEGMHLRSTFIPGDVIIYTPQHTIQRGARSFTDPLSFIPERWTDEKPQYVLDKRAFMPFSTGTYNCIGQKLAMMEMRSIVANLVRNFDMRFADGEKGQACEMETQDAFTICVGKLDVKLTPRR